MDKTRIDGQKLDLHPARVAQWLAAKDDWAKAQNIYPMYVEFSPYGVCNHQCTFCSVDYVIDRKDHPMLSYDVFARTLETMARHEVLGVMFAGAGEPTLYRDKAAGKDLADIILLCDDLGIDTALTTNGTHLDAEFCARAFKARRLRWVRTSINAGTPETYARIHRTKESDFHTVVSNLRRAAEIRNQMHAGVRLLAQAVAVPAARGVKGRHHLAVFEDYPTNIDTIVPLAQLMRQIGMDNLAVKPYKQHTVAMTPDEEKRLGTTRSDMYHGTSYSGETWDALFDELQAIETPAFEITIRRGAMDQQEAEWRGYNTCHSTPFFWAYVEADGEVWGCSAYLGRVENGKEIGDHRFRFGNLNEQPFEDIWRGDRRRACWDYTRRPPAEGGLDVSQCFKGCQMDMPNLYLWRLMNPEPTDNFIK